MSMRNEELGIRNEGGGFAANIYRAMPALSCKTWDMSEVCTSTFQNFAALPYLMRRTTISHFAFLISNFSFEQSFHPQSVDEPPRGLALKFESRDEWLGIRD